MKRILSIHIRTHHEAKPIIISSNSPSTTLSNVGRVVSTNLQVRIPVYAGIHTWTNSIAVYNNTLKRRFMKQRPGNGRTSKRNACAVIEKGCLGEDAARVARALYVTNNNKYD